MGFGKDGKGQIIQRQLSITLSTLAGGNVITGTPLVMTENFRVLKAEVYASIEGLTAGEGAALLIGLARGSLSDNQIEEALNGAPVGPNDQQNIDRAGRPVWIMGATDQRGSQAGNATKLQFSGEHGLMLTAKPRWTFHFPAGWTFWVFNYDNSALTTGATVRMHIKLYGVWVT